MRKIINWKIFFILLGLSLFSVICIFPYVLTIQKDVLSKIKISIGFLFLAQLIQSTILFSIAIFLGLFFTKKIGFHLPVLEALVEKRDYKKILENIAGLSIFLGIIAAIVIYVLDNLFSIGGAGITTHQQMAPVWQTLLAAFYGGITEEILLRLFVMTFFIWIGMKIFRKNQPTKVIIIVSIILAAVIFGLGHLPITASITKIDMLVVARAIALNGIAGIVFGWLFWKKGLESAMLAHFTADIFLLTLLPLLIK